MNGVVRRDGGQDGQVIDMQLVGDGVWESVYIVPIQVGQGSHRSQYLVQLDTGSADLWLASKACRSDACSGVPSSDLFSPTPSTVDTGSHFEIHYVEGDVSGPIVWDTVQVGSYAMSNQAFASANEVENEPLASNFVGVMGLALTSESVIAYKIPPLVGGSGDTPDGATVASNIFGLTPTSDAPQERLFGVLLERIGMSPSDSNPGFIPSVFSIGRHPTDALSNLLLDVPPSATADISSYVDGILPKYTTSIDASPNGDYLFWRTSLTLLSIYTPAKIDLSFAGSSTIFPSVILDTGGSTILARPDIANAIYGAINIDPASDGNYYLPCDKILNITITLSSLPPIPVHPLDLTAEPPDSAPGGSSTCMGVIQASDALSDSSGPADIVLGAAFLRNAYTVLWHETPDFDGGGTTTSSTTTSSSSISVSMAPTSLSHSSTGGTHIATSTTNFHSTPLSSPSPSHSPTLKTTQPNPPANRKRSFYSTPRRASARRSPSFDNIPAISLIPLTNITLALEQFNTVRVLNQPLSSSGSGNPRGANGSNAVKVGHKLSLGIVILLCILGLGCAVAMLFAGWWITQKRKVKKRGIAGMGFWEEDGRKVELRALGTGSSVGSDGKATHDGDGDGSFRRSERSRSDSSVKFALSARTSGGEADEFGEVRARSSSKTRSKGRPRTTSRSLSGLSGYFREPEPWEVAGGETFSDEEDRVSDYDEDRTPSRESTRHRPPPQATTLPQSHFYDTTETPYLPPTSHNRPSSQLGEISEDGPFSVPLLDAVAKRDHEAVEQEPNFSSASNPSAQVLDLPPISPSHQQKSPQLHQQLFSGSSGDDRYPILPPRPSSPTRPRSGVRRDLVDLSYSSSFHDIPPPSALTTDSYFPTLPSTLPNTLIERERFSLSSAPPDPPEVNSLTSSPKDKSTRRFPRISFDRSP